MLIKNASVFIDGKFHDVDVRFENGLIQEIGKKICDDLVVEASGKLLFPGFIENHIHAGANVSLSDSKEAVEKICRVLPQYGITSFTPTPIASTIEESVKAIRNIRAAKGCLGSDMLGIYLYSPYKNRSITYYDPPVIPTVEHTLELVDHDLSDIFSILVAPELDKDHKWIDYMIAHGVLPVIGFSEGTYKDIHEAVTHGATLTDHFYNGFPPLDHHYDNATCACLLEEKLNFQMIFDGIHVAVPYIKLAIKMKGIDHILPVSDVSKFVGMPDGEYDMDGKRVFLKNGAVRNIDGKLVTGAHSFDENMRTMFHGKYFTLEEIGTLFSENAAKILRLNDRGKIEIGRRADLVLMDQDLNVEETYVLGKRVYKKGIK